MLNAEVLILPEFIEIIFDRTDLYACPTSASRSRSDFRARSVYVRRPPLKLKAKHEVKTQNVCEGKKKMHLVVVTPCIYKIYIYIFETYVRAKKCQRMFFFGTPCTYYHTVRHMAWLSSADHNLLCTTAPAHTVKYQELIDR